MNMRVLVVDDFATMRRILKNILKQIFHKCHRGRRWYNRPCSAQEGQNWPYNGRLKYAQNDTGLDLLKAVRGDDSLKDIPFVMITAEAQKDNVIQAVQAGVSNYIVKPFTAETLKEKLKQMFDT